MLRITMMLKVDVLYNIAGIMHLALLSEVRRLERRMAKYVFMGSGLWCNNFSMKSKVLLHVKLQMLLYLL